MTKKGRQLIEIPRQLVGAAVVVTVALIAALVYLGASDFNPNESVESEQSDRQAPDAGSGAASAPRVQGHREKAARMQEIFDGMPSGSDRDKSTAARIRKDIKTYAENHEQNPNVLELECRGDALCRAILEYSDGDQAARGISALQRKRMFSWQGSIVSTKAPPSDNPSKKRQLLLLLDSKYQFDGWNIIAGPPAADENEMKGERR